eukprot:3936693-Rhodomonas_salina.1
MPFISRLSLSTSTRPRSFFFSASRPFSVLLPPSSFHLLLPTPPPSSSSQSSRRRDDRAVSEPGPLPPTDIVLGDFVLPGSYPLPHAPRPELAIAHRLSLCSVILTAGNGVPGARHLGAASGPA